MRDVGGVPLGVFLAQARERPVSKARSLPTCERPGENHPAEPLEETLTPLVKHILLFSARDTKS